MIHKAVFILASLASLTLGLSAATPAQAQAYPSRPITMLVSFPPGGPTDLVARALAQEMSGTLEQNIVVVNRAGAGGAIGATAIADATPDGYTVGFVSVAALTIRPHMHPERYKLDSFDYLCRAYDIPVFAMVRPDSRFKTMRDLIDFARANPGVLNYATVGAGSLPNMAVLNLSREADIRMTHIPYKGEGPAAMALLGKQVDIYFGTNAAATRHNLHRLAVASGARSAQSPDTPTLAELGYDVEWSIMGGMIAPKGIDAGIRSKLEASCRRAAASASYAQTLERAKVQPLYADSQRFRQVIVESSAENHELLKTAGLLAPAQ